jgi:hypothetical protein
MPRARRAPPPDGPDLSHIPEPLRSLAIHVGELNLDPNNSQDHTEASIQGIVGSFRQFGQDQLLVVQRTGMVVRKGNGRLLAARELGWTHVAAVVIDEDDDRAVLRAITDNASSELSPWRGDILASVMAMLPPFENNPELTALLDNLLAANPAPEEDEPATEESPAAAGGPPGGDVTEPPERRDGPSEEPLTYNLVFDDTEQRDIWYSFLRELRNRMPDLETHGQRLVKFLTDNEDRVRSAAGVPDEV